MSIQYKIGICGIGVVGNALLHSFQKRNITTYPYDKYKNIGNIEKIILSDIIFLCLPTLYSEEKKEYDKSSIYEVCEYLQQKLYSGIVVIKSTVEPGTCRYISDTYKLHVLHNPEFLSAKTAKEDFENQNHIVIGGYSCNNSFSIELQRFYTTYWNNIQISISIYEETELMKLGVNCFYATKIQFCNELFLLSKKYKDTNYDNIMKMMIKNGWIHPNHTNVPGADNLLSYGGMCFPKDTNALCQVMKKNNIPNLVLESVIKERNSMRND